MRLTMYLWFYWIIPCAFIVFMNKIVGSRFSSRCVEIVSKCIIIFVESFHIFVDIFKLRTTPEENKSEKSIFPDWESNPTPDGPLEKFCLKYYTYVKVRNNLHCTVFHYISVPLATWHTIIIVWQTSPASGHDRTWREILYCFTVRLLT